MVPDDPPISPQLEPGVTAISPSGGARPHGLQRMFLRALFEHGFARRFTNQQANTPRPQMPAPVHVREATAEDIATGAVCRFCFDATAVDETLIAPCACNGSQLWVHKECLRKWQRASMRAGTGHEQVCSVCSTPYALPPPMLPVSSVRAGMLLVAAPDLGGMFAQSVILIAEVNARGAHGVIINRPIPGQAPMCACHAKPITCATGHRHLLNAPSERQRASC